jgi:hypothetical protein
METIRTNLKIYELYREMKPSMTYETFLDFIDHVIRLGVFQVQKGIAARATLVK